jgi:hypothetical protein
MMCKRLCLSTLLGLLALLVVPLPGLTAPEAPPPVTAPSGIPSPPPCNPAGAGTIAANGCCEGHKGVCGCRAGRIVCCDGSASATCSCHRESDQGASL